MFDSLHLAVRTFNELGLIFNDFTSQTFLLAVGIPPVLALHELGDYR